MRRYTINSIIFQFLTRTIKDNETREKQKNKKKKTKIVRMYLEEKTLIYSVTQTISKSSESTNKKSMFELYLITNLVNDQITTE